MKHMLITMGPYRGQTLQLEDDVAASAVKDKWGVDPSSKDYDAHAVEMGSASSSDLPDSYAKFLDLSPKPAATKPAAKAADTTKEEEVKPKPKDTTTTRRS